jgi:hypothetical protein
MTSVDMRYVPIFSVQSSAERIRAILFSNDPSGLYWNVRFRAMVGLIEFKPERRRSGVGPGRVAGAWAVTASGMNEAS